MTHLLEIRIQIQERTSIFPGVPVLCRGGEAAWKTRIFANPSKCPTKKMVTTECSSEFSMAIEVSKAQS